jgi:hypothetical protein
MIEESITVIVVPTNQNKDDGAAPPELLSPSSTISNSTGACVGGQVELVILTNGLNSDEGHDWTDAVSKIV